MGDGREGWAGAGSWKPPDGASGDVAVTIPRHAASVLEGRSDALRDLALVVACALLPLLALGGLGARAMKNEAAATERALTTLVSSEGGRIERAFARDLSEAEARLVAGGPGALAYADDISLRLEDGAASADASASAEPTPTTLCTELRQALIRASTEARPSARDALLRACPLARSWRGRLLAPWLLLEDPARGGELSAWLGAHADLLERDERVALAEALRSAGGAERASLATRLLAPTGSHEPQVMAALSAALRARTVAAGAVANVDEAGVAGRFFRQPDGRYVGFVITAASLERAIAQGALPVARDTVVRVGHGPSGGQGTVAKVAISRGLSLVITLAHPDLVAKRTRDGRLLLGAGGGGTLLLAFCFLGLVFTRMRDARRTSELRTDFVAAVSHELRTPAASLQMLAELSATPDLPASERSEVGAALVAESRRLSRTVERLLSLRRLLAGKLTLSRARVDLSTLLDEAADAIELPIEARAYAPAIVAQLDAGALRLAVDNLLANAQKHGRAPYELRATVEGTRVVIEVSDDGEGVPAADARRIFEPFERAKDRLSEATEGTGIGLSLVRGIVQAHGGAVVCLPPTQRPSAAGRTLRGARFRISLPRGDVS